MSSREPLTIVEIDQDFCTRTFGVSPCRAALSASTPSKCFNTYATCADKDNYERGVLTLRFGRDIQARPSSGETIFPALESEPDIQPSIINPASSNRNFKPFGRRASVRVILRDFPYHDRAVDKYAGQRKSGAAFHSSARSRLQGAPEDRGTFWSRWRARNPYYLGRPLRIRRGVDGDALEDMETHHYVIDRIDGPDSNGRVSITAKDVLKLAEDSSAQAPAPSSGSLAAELTEDAAAGESFSILPEGAGEDYPASGWAAIEGEIVRFARTGDSFRIEERGAFETEIASHEQNEAVQECFVRQSAHIEDILRDLLVDYAGIDESFIDSDGWRAEADVWLSHLHDIDIVVPEPTGVETLIGEASLIGPYIWWDARIQKIRIKALRPVLRSDALPLLTDEGHIKRAETRELREQRLTEVLLFYGLRNPTLSLRDKKSYHRLQVATALEAASPEEYGLRKSKEVFTRWLRREDVPRAAQISLDVLRQNRHSPHQITLQVEKGALGDAWTGDAVRLSSEADADALGFRRVRHWLIVSADAREMEDELVLLEVDFRHLEVAPGLPLPTYRYAFVARNDELPYAQASEDRRNGDVSCWLAGSDGLMSDGTEGYRLIGSG